MRRAEIERAKRKRPDNLDAYDLYLRALEHQYTFTPAGREAALSLLDTALAIDSGYAEAHGVAANCLQQRYMWGGRAPSDREAALSHAEAVGSSRTDDATALAFAAFAMSALAGKHDTALAMVERALAQNPSSAAAHNISAAINSRLGRFDRSREHADRSIRLSPFDPLRHMPETARTMARLAAGENEDALACARRALVANPDFPPARLFEAVCLVRLDQLEEARASLRLVLERSPDTSGATLRERSLTIDAGNFDAIVTDLRKVGLPE